jgi:hypothetical protein
MPVPSESFCRRGKKNAEGFVSRDTAATIGYETTAGEPNRWARASLEKAATGRRVRFVSI